MALPTPTVAVEAPKPPPYSLPWQLRPMAPVRVLRLDDSYSTYGAGTANVFVVNGVYTIKPSYMFIARLGLSSNFPTTGTAATSFMNPVLGFQYLYMSGPLRLAAFLGVTIPVGSGGGDAPTGEAEKKAWDGAKAANTVGIQVRSAMDNAMFAVNDLTVFPGVSAAFVKGVVTVQWEATLLQLMRVRGANAQPDTSKTNFTTGLHLGGFLLPQLSVGTELRYQKWLVPPAAIKANLAAQENLSICLGFRAHFKVGDIWLRPGISFSRGLIGPMATNDHNIFQFDVPIIF